MENINMEKGGWRTMNGNIPVVYTREKENIGLYAIAEMIPKSLNLRKLKRFQEENMKRFLYDRIVKEYSKESKEELIQRIMSLEEIECNDRSFANQCFSNVTVLHINELFAALEEMKKNPSHENVTKVIKHVEWAENSWNCILRGLSEMNDNSRCSRYLKDFKRRVAAGRESI